MKKYLILIKKNRVKIKVNLNMKLWMLKKMCIHVSWFNGVWKYLSKYEQKTIISWAIIYLSLLSYFLDNNENLEWHLNGLIIIEKAMKNLLFMLA